LLVGGCAQDNLALDGLLGPAAPPAQSPPQPTTPQVITPAPPAAQPTPPQVNQPATGPAPRITVEQAPRLSPLAAAGIQPIKVGLLLPLSGSRPAAELGQEMLDAALLALFDFGDERLELLPRDTRGTAAGAVAAANDVLQQGAQLILGPLFRTSVSAVAPIARERGVPVVAFSSDRSVAGDGIYLLSFTPEQEVRRVVEYAIARGMFRFAVLAPDNAYGQAVVDETRQVVFEGGAEIVDIRRYAAATDTADAAARGLARYEERRQALLERRQELELLDDEAAKRELRFLENRDTLGELDIDAVVLPEGGAQLRAVAPLLPYYDVDLRRTRLIGTGRWDDPSIGKEPTMIGAWFAGADRAASGQFRQRFATRYGRLPQRLTSLAHDAAALAAVLGRREGGPDYTATALTDPVGYAGVDGIFRFRDDGTAERGLAVLEIKRDTLVTIDPAPNRFERRFY